MAVSDPSVQPRRSLREMARAHRVLAGMAIAALVLVVVVAVPPLRRGLTIALSRVILVVTTPFTPDVPPLDQLGKPATVVAKDGTVLGPVSNVQRTPVRLADLPPHVKQAFLAAEDSDFYSHDGVDPSAVVRAALNMASGSGTQGGSTITQQLAKINYTDGQRTFTRKLREVLYATELERRHSKDELLERYMNQVYFGESTFGVGAAAQRTFGKPATQLAPQEAALLAARVRSPGGVDPRGKAERALRTRNAVLATMAQNGWVPREQLAELQAAPLGVIPLPPTPSGTHFLDLIAREAETLGALGATPEERLARVNNTPLVIESTLDPKAQNTAADLAKRRLGTPGQPSAAIVSVQPGDGAIRVLVGDSQGGRFDLATQGRRQAGSSFKPLVYVAAIQDGINPITTTFDSSSPKTLKASDGTSFTVKNAEPGGRGPMSVDDAMVDSVNVVYSQLVVKVGPKRVVDVAQQLGYPKLNATPSIALGGTDPGVSPIEQAAAYAAFANRGEWVAPYGISRIRSSSGKDVVHTHKAQRRQAISREQAGVVNEVLLRVVGEGTGRRAQFGRQVAGKTGTTNDTIDAWFVGYTPQMATAVWVGFPDAARPMPEIDGRPVYGGTIPAELFAGTMRAALAGVRATALETNTPADIGLGGPATTVRPPTTAPPDTAPTTLPVLTTTTRVCPSTTSSSSTSTSTTMKPNNEDPPSVTLPTTTTSTTRPPGC